MRVDMWDEDMVAALHSYPDPPPPISRPRPQVCPACPPHHVLCLPGPCVLPAWHMQIIESELEAAASAMGYGAVKYADLKNHRTTNYKFNYDEMLSLKVRPGRQGAGCVALQGVHAAWVQGKACCCAACLYCTAVTCSVCGAHVCSLMLPSQHASQPAVVCMAP